jgi:hypothetical protein
MNMKGIKLVNRLSEKLGLPSKKVYDLLYLLKSEKKIENRQLIRKLGVSRNVLNQVKGELSRWLEPVSGSTKLNAKGEVEAGELVGGSYLAEEKLWEFLDKQIEARRIKEIMEEYKEIRPISDRSLDQFSATAKTVARRAGLMNFFEDVRGKRIGFLGDDDLTSVAVAVGGRAERIWVGDIDERMLKVVKAVSKEKGLEIDVQKYDAVQKLPKGVRGRFDVIFSDPPYTPGGIKLFLSRAVEALDSKNKAGRIYLCYGNSDRAKERFLPVFEIINHAGLMARWVFDKFNRYHGAESIGGASSLLVCEVTPRTKILIKGGYQGNIYTG